MLLQYYNKTAMRSLYWFDGDPYEHQTGRSFPAVYGWAPSCLAANWLGRSVLKEAPCSTNKKTKHVKLTLLCKES